MGEHMACKIRRYLLILNYLAAIFFALGWAYTETFVALDTNANVTALDRAGGINHENLQRAYPSLADNPRYKLGIWIAASEHAAASRTAMGGLFIAVLNIIALHLAKLRKSPDSLSGTASSL